MDIVETTRLCKAIASIKPAQFFDPETPAFWSLILIEIRYEDAKQAVINLGGRSRFIDPSDIFTEVKRIRGERLEHADRVLPDVDPDNVQGWLEARRAGIAALADGATEPPPPIPAESHPRLEAALPAVFSRPPRPLAIAAEGGPQPAKVAPVKREPTSAERAAEDAERERQLAALEAMPPEEAAS